MGGRYRIPIVREMSGMVRRETCSQCKGDRHVPIVKSDGENAWIKCPSCGGQGYKIRAGS